MRYKVKVKQLYHTIWDADSGFKDIPDCATYQMLREACIQHENGNQLALQLMSGGSGTRLWRLDKLNDMIKLLDDEKGN